MGPAGTSWSPVFSTGASHPHSSQPPALPLPVLKQKSPDFSRTDPGSSPSSTTAVRPGPEPSSEKALLPGDRTTSRTAKRVKPCDTGPSGAPKLVEEPTEGARSQAAARVPNPHRGPTLDRPVPAPLEINFTRTIHQSHKCTSPLTSRNVSCINPHTYQAAPKKMSSGPVGALWLQEHSRSLSLTV